MLYAQATFRQGLQSFRKRHHPDFRRQLSTPWTSRARCCRSASFHTGGCARRIAALPVALRTHTVSESTPTPVCKSPVLRLKSVESAFAVPSGRRFPHKMSGKIGRWMTTEFPHRSMEAHDARAASSFHTGARTSESPPSSGELPTLGFSCSMEKRAKTGA